MPWKETCRMSERLQFIARLRQGERMTDLCREFGISRKTGYKLKNRFEEFGLDALLDQSRAPRRIPHRTSEAVRELVVRARRQHPTWGPKKLKAWLQSKHEGLRLPSPSTIGQILRVEGLVKVRRRSPRRRATPTDLRQPASANEAASVRRGSRARLLAPRPDGPGDLVRKHLGPEGDRREEMHLRGNGPSGPLARPARARRRAVACQLHEPPARPPGPRTRLRSRGRVAGLRCYPCARSVSVSPALTRKVLPVCPVRA